MVNHRVRTYRQFVLLAGLFVLLISTLRTPIQWNYLGGVLGLWLLFSFQAMLPFKLFTGEMNVVPVAAVGVALLFGPVQAGWTVLLGALTSYGIRRYASPRLRSSWLVPPGSFLVTIWPTGAILLALCLSYYLVLFFGNESTNTVLLDVSAEILVLITYTAFFALLVLFDVFLNKSHTQRDRSQDFLRLTLLLALPLPFILVILQSAPAGWMGTLFLIGGLSSILAVLLFRQGRVGSNIQARLDDLEALNQFSVQMTSTLETGVLLDQLCFTAARLSACKSSAVFLHYLGEGRIQLESAYQLSDHFLNSNRSFLFSTGGRAQCLSTGRSVLVSSLAMPEHIQGNIETSFLYDLRREGIQAYGDFPLVSPDGAIGYLSVYYDCPHPFSLEDVQLLEMIAAQAAISISNARLHARTDLTLSRRIHQLSILESVGRQLAESIQSDRLFEMILNYAVEFTDSNWGSIGLLNVQAKRVVIKASRGYTGLPTLLSANEGLVGKAIQSQQPVNSEDVGKEKDYIDFSQGKARSHLSVPMLRASKVLGVITLESARPQAFSSADEMFIYQLAIQAVVATELYQSVQTRELITETLVHDIRSPVTAVLGSLEVIEDSARSVKEGRAVEASLRVINQAVGVARQGAYRVLGLIESLLDIARFQSGKIEIILECVKLHPLVSEVLQTFEAQSTDYGIGLCNQVPEDLPDLYIDQGKIARVLFNLVDNALKFSPSGSQVRIRAEAHGKEDIFIQVIDHGPGIPDEYREQIFERYIQIPGVQGRRRGTGLGLTFCRLAVEAHGGQIWVESNPEGGSSFNLTLPSTKPSGSSLELILP